MGLVVSSTLLVVSNSIKYSFRSYRTPLVFPITLLVVPHLSIMYFFCDRSLFAILGADVLKVVVTVLILMFTSCSG